MKKRNQLMAVFFVFTMLFSLWTGLGDLAFADEDVSVFNKAYIASFNDNKIEVLNLLDNTIEETIDVGTGPCAASISPDGKYLFVSNNRGDTVSVVDLDLVPAKVVKTLEGEFNDPMAITFNSDGSKVYIANRGGNNIVVVDTKTWAQKNIETLSDTACSTTIGDYLYVTSWKNHYIYKIDMRTDQRVATIELDSDRGSFGIAANLEATKLYVAGQDGYLNVIDVSSFEVKTRKEIAEEKPLTGIDISPDGSKIYVISCTSSEPKCYILNATDYSEIAAVDIGDLCYGLGIQGDYAYALSADENKVTVIDLKTNEVSGDIETLRYPLALGPFMVSTRIYNEVVGHNISVDTLTGGKITTSATTTSAGITVTLTVTPEEGMQLVEGSLKYTDSIGTHAITDNSFVMPASNVTITAEFEAIPAETYTVTFDKNGGTTEATPSQRTATSGGTVTLPVAPTRSGYTFTSWNTLANGTGTEFTSETLIKSDITVYAQWKVVSSDHSSGGESSESPSTEAPANDTSSVINKKTETPEVDAEGNKSTKVTVTTDEVSKAIANATENVEIDITSEADVKTVATTMPNQAINALNNANASMSLKLKTALAEITFDHNALSTIAQEVEDITFIVSSIDTKTLSAEAQKVVEENAVFDFKVLSGDRIVSNFNGNVMLSLPYTLKEGEDPNKVVVYYIKEDGEVEEVTNSIYDEKAGVVRFSTTHFSQYAVGYNGIKFEDVSNSQWYSEAINFISARGITVKTAGEKFYPNEKLTRGEFLVMIMRAYGVKPDEHAKDNFADAGDAYYTGYLGSAKALGLAHGVGDNLFLPEAEMSRQEMATFIYNVLEKMGKLPKQSTNETFAQYLDTNEIATWAEAPMKTFVETGIISGYAKRLSPKQSLTRAEGVQVLFNLIGKE